MSFTEETAFRDSVRKMVARHVAPIAAEIDETDRFPLELVKLFGEMGLMQLWVPEKYGGPSGNLTMVCIAREEISKVSPACASIAGLNSMFIMPLLQGGLRRHRDQYPRKKGRRLLHPQRPQTMVQLRRRSRLHRGDGAHRGRPRGGWN
jgi:alkylation response protein AidB-like acyl-CoA dehydrogenase